MRIDCPWCGKRNRDEFRYLGDANVKRPEADADMQNWIDFVYLRDNPAGVHRELWYHAAGCHSWLVVTRDTTTHEITDVTLAGKKS